MSYGMLVMKIPILLLLSSVFWRTNGDVYYVPKFTSSIVSCDDFENGVIDCDELLLGSLNEDEGEDAAKLTGKIETLKEIGSDYDIVIYVWKMLDLVDEFMYSTRVNFCASLENTDTPWYPLVEELEIKSCPIPVKVFEVQGFQVSLDALRDFISHDFCGEYRIQMSLMNRTEKLTCHNLEICIVEKNDENE